jgi:H+-transporting ATPase
MTRTRGPFWTIKPAKVLWMAVLGTQVIATLIAVYGPFMTPLGWKYAGVVWAYAIIWALFTDRLKLLAYRILDPSALPLLAKKQANLGPEISKEAFELFQQRAHGEGQQDKEHDRGA